MSHNPEDYTVGWICAIPTELIAAKAMLDETHSPLKSLPKHDENNYTLGRIGAHNVVLACLPYYGTNNAAIAGKSMQNTFPNLRFDLMVGVGGGIPSEANDIRLGDVVVSFPSGQSGGVIQYGTGKEEESGFRRTGFLNSPPTLLLTAISTLRGTRGLEKKITETINIAFEEDEDEEEEWRFPADAVDTLSEIDAVGAGRMAERTPRKTKNPRCFYGTIGSGNCVIKNARERDLLARQDGLICVEMEAAGLMNFFKCIVIRGICDYADEHKHKEWQPYAAAVAAAYAKMLLSVISPGEVAKMDPIRKNRHWMVPRQINPNFTGRADILKTLQQRLCPGEGKDTTDVQKRFVICGMGGSGKSEVCLKFANENRECFWGIFWIDASDADSIKRGIISAAKIVCGSDLAYEDAKRWFENQDKNWLLIYDNSDNSNLNYSRFFPSGDRGAILMSTRLTDCQQYSNVGIQDADFEKLGFEDSLELLRKTSKVSPDEWVRSLDIAHTLIGDEYLCQHALAINQAGAFIRQNLCTLEEYPCEFQRQRARLLTHRLQQAESQYGDVYATFEVSAHAMKNSNRQEWVDALELLHVLAFMHREGVPEEMFTKAWGSSWITMDNDSGDDIGYCSLWHVNHMRRLLRHMNEEFPRELNITALREARNALKSFSLITIHPESKDISMHPLVHAWAKDRLEKDAQSIAWATTASILALSVENVFGYREYLNEIQPHIEACIGLEPPRHFKNQICPRLEIDRILYALGWVAYRTRSNHFAETIANTLSSRIGHEIRPRSMNWRHILYVHAVCLYQLTNYKGAMHLIQRVVSYDKDHLAPDDQISLNARELLGLLHAGVGELSDAIQLHEEVFQTRRKLLKPEDDMLLTSQHQLACAYLMNNQIKEGLALLLQVVRIMERNLSPTHPHLLSSRHQLGSAYIDNNQIQKGIALLADVVQIREKILPPTHPKLLTSQHELGIAYLFDKQFERAIEILENVVRIKESVLPRIGRERLVSQDVLAAAYYRNGNYEKALPLIREVVEIRSQILKPEDPVRVNSENLLFNCRDALREQGLYIEETVIDACISTEEEEMNGEMPSGRIQQSPSPNLHGSRDSASPSKRPHGQLTTRVYSASATSKKRKASKLK